MNAPARIRALPVLILLAVLLATLVGAPPAQAAGDYMGYDGETLNMARVPATMVTIETLSVTRATSATYSVEGRAVGSDTSLTRDGDRWRSSARVDLSGLHGVTQLTVKLVDGGSSRPVWRFFRAIPVPASSPAEGAVPRKGPAPGATGVPAGTRLARSGGLDIRRAGTVVDGLDITGCVTVRARHVVIRNTRIRCSDPAGDVAVHVRGGGQGLVLDHVEVDGRGRAGVCVGYGGYTLRRSNVHGCVDGARFGSDVTIEDSWVHDLVRRGDLHPDALQSTGGDDVVVRRNLLDARAPGGAFTNAALMLGTELGSRSLRRVLVEDNHLDGGNYALNVRGDVRSTSLTVRGNTFGDATRYGPAIAPTRVPLGAGNVYAATGEAVRVVAAD